VRGAPSSKIPNWNTGHATATCGNLLSVLNLCIKTKYHSNKGPGPGLGVLLYR
jgi:hypothetical protein